MLSALGSALVRQENDTSQLIHDCGLERNIALAERRDARGRHQAMLLAQIKSAGELSATTSRAEILNSHSEAVNNYTHAIPNVTFRPFKNSTVLQFNLRDLSHAQDALPRWESLGALSIKNMVHLKQSAKASQKSLAYARSRIRKELDGLDAGLEALDSLLEASRLDADRERNSLALLEAEQRKRAEQRKAALDAAASVVADADERLVRLDRDCGADKPLVQLLALRGEARFVEGALAMLRAPSVRASTRTKTVHPFDEPPSVAVAGGRATRSIRPSGGEAEAQPTAFEALRDENRRIQAKLHEKRAKGRSIKK